MKTRTYVEKVSIPECTAVHHVWSFDGASPEIGSLCECGQSRWDNSHLTLHAPDVCHRCGATQPINWVECSECGTRR